MDRRERTQLYEQYEKVLEVFDLPKLDTRIPARSKFSKETMNEGPVYRSTILAPDLSFIRESRLDELTAEILKIINLYCHA